MRQAYENLGLNPDHVIGPSGRPTELGKLLCDYFSTGLTYSISEFSQT